MRAPTPIAIAAVTVLLSACGGSDGPVAPGSPENPLVAEPQQETTAGRSNEASGSTEGKPGYRELVERQSSDPGSRFTPCLVSRGQARTILGAPVVAPVEAPQGPTCIYRSERGGSFVTMAVQSLDFDRLGRQMQRPRSLDVGDRRAVCGVHGQPMLYVSLPGRRVLSVGAPCPVAQRFASSAVARLGR